MHFCFSFGIFTHSATFCIEFIRFCFGLSRSLVGWLFLFLLKFLLLGSESYLSTVCLLHAIGFVCTPLTKKFYCRFRIKNFNTIWRKNKSSGTKTLVRNAVTQFNERISVWSLFFMFLFCFHLLCKRIARLYGDTLVLHLFKLFSFLFISANPIDHSMHFSLLSDFQVNLSCILFFFLLLPFFCDGSSDRKNVDLFHCYSISVACKSVSVIVCLCLCDLLFPFVCSLVTV